MRYEWGELSIAYIEEIDQLNYTDSLSDLMYRLLILVLPPPLKKSKGLTCKSHPDRVRFA